ncbi:hypothetical protein GCM10025864_38130 [Luteimicrobium album]|uniref:Uncharacterized protein n=1 Tax=Luteimicrobium album TaxID=1054550 RepID=A0ABQ6I7T8_9MICO|nr:hypothetical protein GCM10025864_38130 [Luteimicrobium album]
MIVHLPETTANDVGKRLVKLRDEGGAVTLGRVLTLIIRVGEDDLEEAVEAANDASREHPCRVIVVSPPVAGTPRHAWTRRSASAGTQARARSSCCVRPDPSSTTSTPS